MPSQPRTLRDVAAARILRSELRLSQAAPTGVAVGGVAGARHYHPGLDLVSLPRLDLSVHAPEREADLRFVRHQAALFAPSAAGLLWADPLECFFDLHESGLQAQASELLEALTPPAGT